MTVELKSRIRKLSDTSSTLKMLVYGDPGVGKTILSGSAPDALFINIEGGTLSLRNMGVNVDAIDIEKFSDINEIYQFLRSGQHPYKSVIIDSLTELQKKAMDKILEDEYVKNPTKRDPDVALLADFGKNTEQLRRVIRNFRDLSMNVIFTALPRETKDSISGEVKVGPSITPKLAEDVVGYLDVIAYMTTRTKDNETSRFIMFQPTGQYLAKDRSSRLPAFMKNPVFSDILGIALNNAKAPAASTPKASPASKEPAPVPDAAAQK